MARGDAWRISGGIFIPNSTFAYDSDYDSAATENIPDGWIKQVNAGVMVPTICTGLSDDRGLRVFNSPITQYNFLGSPVSPPGSFPWRAAVVGLQVRLRLVFWYKKSGANQTILPNIVAYNSVGSPIDLVAMPSVSAAATEWTKYDNTVLVDANIFDEDGGPASYIRVQLNLGASAIAETLWFDDFTVGYQLTDVDGSNGYDELTGRPDVPGLTLSRVLSGAFTRSSLGQMRYVDTTGGVVPFRLSATFSTARDTDRLIMESIMRLHSGTYCPDTDSSGAGVPYASGLVTPSPVVIEPYIGDGATRSAGKLRENFYAWITEYTPPEPVGYLGNVWRYGIVAEEVC